MSRVERLAVVAEAHTWVGTPYHHMGRVKGAGVDCGQLLAAVYTDVGLVEPFDIEQYPHDWMMHRDGERYLGCVLRFAHRVDEPRPGDIVVWRVGRCVSHGAIVVEWPRVIHAYMPDHCCVIGDATKGDLSHREPLFYSIWED